MAHSARFAITQAWRSTPWQEADADTCDAAALPRTAAAVVH